MTEERKPMANIPPFGLRMQPDLKAKVEDAARANNRSLNAEIIARLEESLDGNEHVWSTINDVAETLEKVQKTLERIAPQVDAMWSRYEG